MADLGSTSTELKAIQEECTEQSTDINQGKVVKQNVEENIEGLIDKNSGKPHLQNKDGFDRKGDSKVSFLDGTKRKFSLGKKSRVEFSVKPNVAHDEGKLSTDTLNKLSNVGRRSPAQDRRRSRQSFSGCSQATSRPLRFFVGANHQPKGLKHETASSASLTYQRDPCENDHAIKNVNSTGTRIFIELDELNYADRTWRETTRWMKYEEHLLPNGNWSRPQVPFVQYEGFLALKDYLQSGLVFLEFSSDGLLDFTHTLATTIIMCNRIERRYRLKLQQLLYLSVIHPGDTAKRLHAKKCYRNVAEKIEADQRMESIKKAFELSSDRVRNLWVNLTHKASMFSKFSAASYDSDLEDADEAMINIYVGGIHNKRLSEINDETKVLIKIPDDQRSVTASEYSEINTDKYPLSADQEHLLKALSRDCEGVAIKYAPCDFLNEHQSFVVLVRMTHGTKLYDFLEVPIDCKFIFLLCGSCKDSHKDLQVCRAFGSLMTDKVFQHDMLWAHKKHDLLNAVDKYVKDSVLFPPGQWNLDYLKPATEEITQLSAQRHVNRTQTVRTPPRIRRKNCVVQQPLIPSVENIQPAKRLSSALPLRRDTTVSADDIMSFLSGYGGSSNPSIVYSPLLSKHPLEPDGRWFGGMRREMTLRYPQYSSDVKDAFHIQCLAAFFFVTFGVVALAVTFGTLLLKYTDGYMGDSEMLLAASFSCMLMAIVGTEPTTVLSGTAAMVVIETVIFRASNLFVIDYLPWRLWIGVWITIILLLILALEKTYWITYCTRFTEEILHALIAVLFIMEAFKDIYKVFQKNPVRDSYILVTPGNDNGTNNTSLESYGRPNTALLHTVILFSTFGIAIGLRLFQDTRYFSPPVRRLLNFFSIPLAVTVMLIVCNLLDVYLNTVQLGKRGINLSSPKKRTWLTNPNLGGKGLSWGMAVLAAFPALFVVIVIFIETEITVLMCYKETVSRKGSGFHTNLLVVAISIFICSILGLPWMCLAAVETSNHLDSLRVWTSYNIPGIKSRVEKVRQQRVTLFFIGLFTGLFLYQPFRFGHIPIALLSGLTLYMGVVATFGVQFFKRLELMFMAPSQHPYIEYLDNVPLLKVHLFTVIQIIMIALLLVIKSIESISFIFPIFIMLMIPMRVLLGKYAFTPQEMEQLDNEQDDDHHH